MGPPERPVKRHGPGDVLTLVAVSVAVFAFFSWTLHPLLFFAGMVLAILGLGVAVGYHLRGPGEGGSGRDDRTDRRRANRRGTDRRPDRSRDDGARTDRTRTGRARPDRAGTDRGRARGRRPRPRRAGEESDPGAALERLKLRYAEGEIDDREFERRAELLVENGSLGEVRDRVGRRRRGPDRPAARAPVRDRERERERER